MPRGKAEQAEVIIPKLREVEVELGRGKTVAEAVKKIGVTMQTYYRQKKKYGGLRMDEAKRLKELQRAGRRPNMKSVKEREVIVALTQLRDLLHGAVGIAAQVLKALVGDVILETRQVEGQAKPQMVARFTINAVPALAVLERGRPTNREGNPGPVWDSIHSSPTAEPPTGAGPADAIVPLIYDRRAAAPKPRKTSRNG